MTLKRERAKEREKVREIRETTMGLLLFAWGFCIGFIEGHRESNKNDNEERERD